MLPLPDEAFSRGDSRLAGTAGGAIAPGDGAVPTGCPQAEQNLAVSEI